MKFLFWNINNQKGSNCVEAVKAIIDSEKPDVILLAETSICDNEIIGNGNLRYIHGITSNRFGLNKQMRLYATENEFNIMPNAEYGEGEMISCTLSVKGRYYLVFGCHFVSKTTITNEEKKMKRIKEYRKFIVDTENAYRKNLEKKGSTFVGSIVFGDFNANPFERPFTDYEGLFAIDIKLPHPSRLKKKPYFINPTFSLLGCYNNRENSMHAAPGSYYYGKKDFDVSTEYFWNTIDGMFFRPSLYNAYDISNPLTIVTEIAIDSGRHVLFDETQMLINDNYSDHLPIIFNFQF